MKEQIIFHCDANSFFASVEIASRPALKDKPVAVTGNPEKRTGIILTKNEIAKKFGVQTGEVIWKAKQKCPNLICLPPHYKLYEEYSNRLRAIYEKYTDRVESFGIDECWLDVTDTLKFFGDAKSLANKIRNEVKNTLNITISVGVSFSKLFAKVGSDMKKPDATTVISRENFKQILYPLPITTVIGIGKRLEKRYNKIGVFKLGQIVEIPDFVLKKKFGILGLELKQKLLGNDNEEVKKCDFTVPPKSIGNSTTTIKDIYSRKEILTVIRALCEEVSTRLRQQLLMTSTLSVTIKTAQFEYFQNAMHIEYPTNNAKDLVVKSLEILDSFWKYNVPVRAIRVCSYNLTKSNSVQLNMFNNLDKKNAINTAIDKIRDKYGYYSICSADVIHQEYLNEFLNTDKLLNKLKSPEKNNNNLL